MSNNSRMDDIIERKIKHKAGLLEQIWTQHRIAVSDRRLSRTTETVTRTTIDGYALPLKTLDDLACALTSVSGAMFA